MTLEAELHKISKRLDEIYEENIDIEYFEYIKLIKMARDNVNKSLKILEKASDPLENG